MKKCIIFCAGEFTELIGTIGADDIVIAADGGLAHLENLPIVPDVILGDFDSLGYVPEGAEVYPVEKDDTDSMLAIKKGLQMGCDTFYIYGALEGKRIDHTMANFQALQYLSQRGCRAYLIGRRQIATAITNTSLELPPYFIDYLSVFCMGADATGVTIRGAQYELENATLTSGFPLGVSNRFIQKKVTVSVENGTLLLIWRRTNGTV
jgi:thiamine pyrophosphokinase